LCHILSTVCTILLKASESWAFTHRKINRLKVFINKCLLRIVNVHWPDKISNNDLCTKTDQEPVLIQIKRRKWSWLRHTLRKNGDRIAQTSFAAATTRPLKKTATKEYLEKRSGVRNGDSRIHVRMEEDGGGGSRRKWSVVYAPLGASRHKSSRQVSYVQPSQYSSQWFLAGRRAV